MKRHWAIISHGPGAGKTTFLATNSRPPVVVVDTDGRFEAVEALALGKVYYPTQTINPRLLADELISLFEKVRYESLDWDSLTKLYSIHARLGYMRARDKVIQNKAAGMIDKSNAMTIARDLAILGTDVYYVWHTTSGLTGSGETEIRDMISEAERQRGTSVVIKKEIPKRDGS